jgi:hypothetical protein
LGGYALLRPHVSVEPYPSRDPHNPFAELFYVQNNSLYTIHEVEPRCGARNVQVGRVSGRGFSVVGPFDFWHDLPPGSKMTVTCHLGELFGASNYYPSLLITIIVDYKAPLNLSRCLAANFNGKPAIDGTFIWTYDGSEGCDKRQS